MNGPNGCGDRFGRWGISLVMMICPVVTVLVLITSCSPRYSIHEVKAEQFVVDKDAYVSLDSSFQVAYDFWGPEGSPFISILNSGADTMYLSLEKSYSKHKAGQRTLLQTLTGGSELVFELRDNYPTLNTVRSNGNTYLLLLPDSWTSFYGAPMAPGPNYGNHRLTHRVDYVYHVAHAAETREISHGFNARNIERLRRGEYKRLSHTRAKPNHFYCDRGPDRERMAVQIGLDVATGVLIIF